MIKVKQLILAVAPDEPEERMRFLVQLQKWLDVMIRRTGVKLDSLSNSKPVEIVTVDKVS